jgi:hypothetical protein
VVLAPVVDPRSDPEEEAHRPASAEHLTDEAMPFDVGGVAADRHEVLDLADAVQGEEEGDQDVRVREVNCVKRVQRSGASRKWPAGGVVEDRSEDARRVEARRAYQSIVPSVATSAAVRRSPMRPWAAIGG